MTLEVSRDGPVGVIRLDRATVLDGQLADGIVAACLALSEDKSVRTLLVSGIFGCDTAAEDAVDFGSGNTLPAARAAAALPAARAAAALAGAPVPVIAAVDGLATGAGAELALACDVRLAARTARFQFGHLARGLLPAAGGTQRLPRIAGRARALELLLLGEPLDATAAFHAGIVTRVLPAGRLMPEARGLAERMARNAPVAVRYLREAIHGGMDQTLEQGLRLEADLYFLLQTTEDRMEGIRAFLERRSPEFHGS